MKKFGVGETIDNQYKVLQVINGGGMAFVYKVSDSKGNLYALKYPKDKSLNDSFMKEALNWKSMKSHVNLLECVNVGRLADIDQFYLTSEWMDGGSLNEWIDGVKGNLYVGSNKQQLDRVLDIAIKIARGLAFLHSQNLKHKDIKPQNIFLSSDGKKVKVADFGLVRDSNATLTSFLATPAYAAPEQTRQNKAKGDITTIAVDVFSWGATVLAMIVGECAWSAGVEICHEFDSYLDDSKVSASKEIITLLKNTTQKDPAKRPDFIDVLKILSKCSGANFDETMYDAPKVLQPKAVMPKVEPKPPVTPPTQLYKYMTLPDGSNGVEFGSYPQGAKGEVEPIQWRILGKDKDGAALLLSDKILDCVKYHRSDTDVQWKDSDIRAWLNGEGEFRGKSFIETAFIPSEIAAIIVANVSGNGVYSKDDLAGTIDKVFLLNTKEASAMGSDDKCRWAQGTAYAKLAGNKKSRNLPNEGGELWVYDGRYDDGKFKDNSYWWLRNRGSSVPSFASVVGRRGNVAGNGSAVGFGLVGVRPALQLNLT